MLEKVCTDRQHQIYDTNMPKAHLEAKKDGVFLFIDIFTERWCVTHSCNFRPWLSFTGQRIHINIDGNIWHETIPWLREMTEDAAADKHTHARASFRVIENVGVSFFCGWYGNEM